MALLNSITLLLNGLAIALSLSFLVITLWQDARKHLNQFFAVFLLLVTLWNMGVLLLQATALVDASLTLIRIAISLMEFGFIGSSIAVYTLTAALSGVQDRRFRWIAFSGLLLVAGYQLVLILTNAPVRSERLSGGTFIYQPQPLSTLFYLTFDTATFYLAWRYRRKIRSAGLVVGIMIFVLGQAIALLNPELGALAVAINVSSGAALVISFAILRREIITPLAERVVQIEAMHKVSLAITSQIALDTVLDQIATQAVGWLDADGSGIFLNRDSNLTLATVYNLPKQFIGLQVALGEGVSGAVVQNRKSIFVENYSRDWKALDDLPLARETFGSVICVPLVYGGEAIGALMVIAGKQGRLFNRDDVHLLELLSAQAAVAIAHSQLFAHQQQLTSEVEAAHSQLEKDVLQLKELDRIKSEMVRMTSHDLKNPIQAAMANLDLLRDDLHDWANPEVGQAIATIDKQLERMNRIISGILDLERVKSGARVAEICHPALLVENTLNEMRPLAHDNRIHLESRVEADTPDFQGDPEQFERALINLVENAIKFTPSGGSVRLVVRCDDQQIIFEISDNGIGIPPELHEQIFERFFRGRQRGAEHVSGSGLGLSLVKAIVDNHNGSISLSSAEGQGTTFSISIPALALPHVAV